MLPKGNFGRVDSGSGVKFPENTDEDSGSKCWSTEGSSDEEFEAFSRRLLSSQSQFQITPAVKQYKNWQEMRTRAESNGAKNLEKSNSLNQSSIPYQGKGEHFVRKISGTCEENYLKFIEKVGLKSQTSLRSPRHLDKYFMSYQRNSEWVPHNKKLSKRNSEDMSTSSKPIRRIASHYKIQKNNSSTRFLGFKAGQPIIRKVSKPACKSRESSAVSEEFNFEQNCYNKNILFMKSVGTNPVIMKSVSSQTENLQPVNTASIGVQTLSSEQKSDSSQESKGMDLKRTRISPEKGDSKQNNKSLKRSTKGTASVSEDSSQLINPTSTNKMSIDIKETYPIIPNTLSCERKIDENQSLSSDPLFLEVRAVKQEEDSSPCSFNKEVVGGIKTPYKCPYCGDVIQRNLLDEHMEIMHRKTEMKPIRKYYPCGDNCSYVGKTKTLLNTHRNSVHLKIQNYECSECSFRSFYKYALNRHEKSHKKI